MRLYQNSYTGRIHTSQVDTDSRIVVRTDDGEMARVSDSSKWSDLMTLVGQLGAEGWEIISTSEEYRSDWRDTTLWLKRPRP